MLFVVIGWVLFRAPDLGYAGTYIGNMFGGGHVAFRSFTPLIDFISLDKAIFMVVGIVASYPVFEPTVRRVPEAVRLACGVLMFAVVFMLAMTSAYSPFIYFRF